MRRFFCNFLFLGFFYFICFCTYSSLVGCSKIENEEITPTDGVGRIGLNARSANCFSGYSNLDSFVVDLDSILMTLDSNTNYCSCDSVAQYNFLNWFDSNGLIIRDTSFNHSPFLINLDSINYYTCSNQTTSVRLNKTKILVNNLYYFGAIGSTNRSLLFQFLDSLVLNPEDIDYCYILSQVQGDSKEKMIVKLPILSTISSASVITETEVFGNQVAPILNHLLGGAAGAWAGAMIAIWDAVEEHGESGLYREDTRLGKKMAQGFFSGFVSSI